MDKHNAVKIQCKGAESFDIEKLIEFQGNLKDLSVDNYNKLKSQILNVGFSEPISVWINDGKVNVLNGHQRLRVLKGLKSEGYFIPPIPVSLIEANSIKDAKQKVLALTSQFGEMTDDGLYEFMNDSGLDISIFEDLRFPEIDFGKWLEGFSIDASNLLPELASGDKPAFQQMTFVLHDSQADSVLKAISKAKEIEFDESLNENSNGNALHSICKFFLDHNAKS